MDSHDGTFSANNLPSHLAQLFSFTNEQPKNYDVHENEQMKAWKHQYRTQLEHPKPKPDTHTTQLNHNPAMFDSPMFNPFGHGENPQSKYPKLTSMQGNVDPTIFGRINPPIALKPNQRYVPGDTRAIGHVNPKTSHDSTWGNHLDTQEDPNSTRYISKRIQEYRFGK